MTTKSRRPAPSRKAQNAQVTLTNFEPSSYKVAASAAAMFLDVGDDLVSKASMTMRAIY